MAPIFSVFDRYRYTEDIPKSAVVSTPFEPGRPLLTPDT